MSEQDKSEPPVLAKIEAIEARAAAATPGSWSYRADRTGKNGFVFPAEVFAPDGSAHGKPIGYTTADAAHIAGMDPPTTLRLCAALREALARAERAEGAGKDDRDARASYSRRWNEALSALPDREPGDFDAVGAIVRLVKRAARAEAIAAAERTLRVVQHAFHLAIVDHKPLDKSRAVYGAAEDALRALGVEP